MSANKIFAIAASIAVAVVVVIGLYLGGSPSEQRLIRYDERRVTDLRSISQSIRRRWNRVGTLPDSLPELVAGQEARRIPVDPDSGESYEFELTADNAYQLCASFARPSVKPLPGDFWAHEAGHQCFEVTLAEEGDATAFPQDHVRTPQQPR